MWMLYYGIRLLWLWFFLFVGKRMFEKGSVWYERMEFASLACGALGLLLSVLWLVMLILMSTWAAISH